MIDSYRHKGLRKKLVEELFHKGINSEKVLHAINQVPRHCFMDSGFVQFSYKDQAFPIAAGQTISQPYTVAYQTELLDVEEGMKVLEVGTGSGYQTAVLMELKCKVYTIERQKQLYLHSQKILNQLGYQPVFFYGDGYEGLPAYSPFDRILITAGAPEIPGKLLTQLKVGGRLVAPVGTAASQEMVLVEKKSEQGYHTTKHGNFIFVPMLKGTQR
jgi:protein-L-isoaspartate(D-aspartate) O-methyltransferase